MADYSSPFPTQFGYVSSPAFSDPLTSETSDAQESDTALSVGLDALMDKIHSGELTVDELLHRIAEQACLQSGGTSAALALLSAEDNAVVCRASCGANAPPLGARLNAYSGISGECLRTGRVLGCDDSETDARVDPLVCRKLGIRSIVALPLRDEHSTVGILEVFSDYPGAFTDKHIQALQNLAYFARAATTLEPDLGLAETYAPATPPQRVVSLPGARPATPASEEDDDILLFEEGEHPGWFSTLTTRLHWTVAASMVSIVLLALSALSLFIWMWKHADSVESAGKPTVQVQEKAAANEPLSVESSTLMTVSARPQTKPEVGLRANGRVKPPKQNAASVVKTLTPRDDAEWPATSSKSPKAAETREVADNDVPPPPLSSTAQPTSDMRGLLSPPAALPDAPRPISEGIVPGRLDRRVAPVYPSQARQMRIEGPVVLRAVIAEDGSVRDISVVKGDPMLARAAREAVKHWRYKPYELNHKPVAISTDITIDFRLQ